MSGLSEASLSFESHRVPGVGAVVVESPIPRATGGSSRQDSRLARAILPVAEDRQSPQASASRARGLGAGRDQATSQSTELDEQRDANTVTFRSFGGSALFAAQVLGQTGEGDGARESEVTDVDRQLASSAYRRSGGDPPLFPESAEIFRIAV